MDERTLLLEQLESTWRRLISLAEYNAVSYYHAEAGKAVVLNDDYIEDAIAYWHKMEVPQIKEELRVAVAKLNLGFEVNIQ